MTPCAPKVTSRCVCAFSRCSKLMRWPSLAFQDDQDHVYRWVGGRATARLQGSLIFPPLLAERERVGERRESINHRRPLRQVLTATAIWRMILASLEKHLGHMIGPVVLLQPATAIPTWCLVGCTSSDKQSIFAQSKCRQAMMRVLPLPVRNHGIFIWSKMDDHE
ncbi:uncharacterized protein BO95DRAFT_53020 [Aspergillus brunneoviolaceus CBS 621.78]|uniref:Uncharacterized protein n=1 Tax=Aspergillus brunneoviolaceus CBS 621.78 TaxID=1450534 RepID=A0ACD1FRI9_9EURO|nr:hypothetical protein BO95DRAFT_53020 [Aspergillus brunneoviolaceus CBS 621.78]RAH39591.1 hypothetical protein BO95DRAFT_53020 [Aspergillus brunneoviolaceus CBS 621.78]